MTCLGFWVGWSIIHSQSTGALGNPVTQKSNSCEVRAAGHADTLQVTDPRRAKLSPLPSLVQAQGVVIDDETAFVHQKPMIIVGPPALSFEDPVT